MAGRHNEHLSDSISRLQRGKTYKDLTTAIVCPTRGQIPCQVVSSWMGLIRPMNQVCAGPFFFEGFEVGDAYNQAFEFVLNTNKQAIAQKQKPFKYVLTIETDNIPDPDALVKLYEHIDDYDALGAIYWTKGEGGMPMLYGDPNVNPKNFIPQMPIPNSIQPCNGLGMGFTLFKLDIFEKMNPPKNERGIRVWFETRQKYIEGKGTQVYTQDLAYFEEAGKFGGRFACDTRVKVGHIDLETNIVW